MAGPEATPRPATPADVPMLARVHVQCWQETYTGLLPAAEIAARGIEQRRRQWTDQIAAGRSRIAVLPDLGFAQAGPQRDTPLLEQGFPLELYALYLLRAGQGRGLGLALLRAVIRPGDGPMSALVLAGNQPAIRFYEASGARRLETRAEHVGAAPIEEHVYVWDRPATVLDHR